MSNHALTFVIVAGLVWTFANAPAPEPVSQTMASRSTPSAPAVPYRSIDGAMAGSGALEALRPPIPLVRNPSAPPATAIAPDVAVRDAEARARDDQDMRAAKAAIEADGYKGVSMLRKEPNGTWRAKAYRGSAEVQLTVDVTGTVSAE